MSFLLPAVKGRRLALVVWEVLVGQIENTLAVDLGILVNNALLQRGRGGHNLKHRAGRVDGLDGAVHQGAFRVLAQFHILVYVVGVDTVGEEVVVIAGHRHHRQDFARLRVHHQGDPTRGLDPRQPLFEDVFHRPLQVQVQRQDDVVARRGVGGRPDGLHRAAGRVHFDDFAPLLAAQGALEGVLRARQANLVG